MMKGGIRILAIDDSTFDKKDKDALVVGVLGRMGIVEGVLSFRADVDGSDATAKIINKVKASRFKDQIRLVAINGMTLAGLNLVDIVRLRGSLGLPVLCIVRKKPSRSRLEGAIKAAIKDPYEKLSLLNNAYGHMKVAQEKGLYLQYIGLEDKEAIALSEGALSLLRLAHVIATGIARGESKGRA
jgi:uncharacterized protein